LSICILTEPGRHFRRQGALASLWCCTLWMACRQKCC